MRIRERSADASVMCMRVCAGGLMAEDGGYLEVNEGQWAALPALYSHAAHAMLYAPWPGKFLDKYEYRFAVSMQIRFDGTLGFPGGMVDNTETPEQAASRELMEETGSKVELTAGDHVVTHVSQHTKLCLHFFAKEVTLQQLHAIESSVTTSSSWGEEVLGLVRVPLYTLPNKLGLPAFLRHQFIGTSRQQLVTGLERCGLLTTQELQLALQMADSSINMFVTQQEIKY